MYFSQEKTHFKVCSNDEPIAECACVDIISFSAVTAGNKEQKNGSQAVISCKVTGLTTVLNGVKWTKSDNSEITSGVDSFVIDTGNSSFSGDTQTTTLTVPAYQTDRDETYICLITSNEHGGTEKSTTVYLKVLSE